MCRDVWRKYVKTLRSNFLSSTPLGAEPVQLLDATPPCLVIAVRLGTSLFEGGRKLNGLHWKSDSCSISGC